MKKAPTRMAFLLFTVVLLVGMVLRLLPLLVYGQPFSTDIWPLIRISSKVVDNPGVPIWEDRFFDGYNNRWPGLVLSTSIASLIVGVNVVSTYSYIYPIPVFVAWASALYLLMGRIRAGGVPGLYGLLYMVSAPSILAFTSAVLKEVYAYPFLYLLLFIALREDMSAVKRSVLALILSSAISVTHPLASIMALGILASTLLAMAIAGLIGLLRVHHESRAVAGILIVLLVLLAVFTAYYEAYGGYGLRIHFNVFDLVVYVLYGLLIYTCYALYHRFEARVVLKIAIPLSLAAFIAIAPRIPLLPGIGIAAPDLYVYMVPAALPLLLFTTYPREVRTSEALISGAMAFVSLNMLYIFLARPELSSVFHRVSNYITLINALLIAYTYREARRGAVRAVAMLISISALIAGAVYSLNLVVGGDDILFYWSYRGDEVLGFNSIAFLASSSVVLAGDAKVSYYMYTYRAIDSLAVLEAMYIGKLRDNAYVILYRDNYVKGYAYSLNIYDIGKFLAGIKGLDRVYDNYYIEVVGRGG